MKLEQNSSIILFSSHKSVSGYLYSKFFKNGNYNINIASTLFKFKVIHLKMWTLKCGKWHIGVQPGCNLQVNFVLLFFL